MEMTISLIHGRKGLYVMTPFMGVVMILIVIAVAYYITSESDQQLN